jgi:hypothetical protein
MTPEDVGISYEQKIVLTGNGINELESITEFIPEPGKIIHRLIAQLHHMPLVPRGDYNFLVTYRKVSDPDWRQVCTYPFRVSYDR